LGEPPPVPCPFCSRLSNEPLADSSEHAVAFADAFPVSPGHHLLIPRRHVVDFFQLRPEEQADLWRLLARLRERLVGEYSPDGFNVGLNVGPAAGQTVDHAHVHLIPRFAGDVADPRGGVRWVVPEKAPYWQGEKD
jgi:diadenosine tetraphosphate (Ap4A) HIT family hydrolase